MENSNRAETSIVIIFTLILLIILGYIIYSAYSSSTNLQNNNSLEEENTQSQPIAKATPNTTNDIEITPTTIETQIASFSSNIYDKDENRVYNISLAISKINGATIAKGETFSFNDTVGPMSEEYGFKEALGFDNDGKKVQMPGGGMCQISSTLYNAALIANLEIVERHPHSRRVYYVPKDKDATIYYGTLDLKIKNTTEYDIKIIATNDDSNVTVILNKITSGI